MTKFFKLQIFYSSLFILFCLIQVSIKAFSAPDPDLNTVNEGQEGSNTGENLESETAQNENEAQGSGPTESLLTQNPTESLNEASLKESQESPLTLDEEETGSDRSIDPHINLSRKTGLDFIASRPYGSEDGFSTGLTGEVLSYQMKHEEKNLNADSQVLFPETKKKETTSYRSSGNLSFYFAYKFSDFQLFHRNFATLFNSKFHFDGNSFHKPIFFDEDAFYTNSSFQKDQSIDLELAYLDFLFHPYLNVRIGHQFLPIGLSNIHQGPFSFLSVRDPEVEMLLIPRKWHENGIQIWGGDFHREKSFFRYSIGGYSSLQALGEDGLNRFTGKHFISNGAGREQDNKSKNVALATRLDFFLPFQTTLGGSFFVGNTTQKKDSQLARPRNNHRFQADKVLDLQKIHPMHVYLWTAHFHSKTNFLRIKALFTQVFLPGGYKLPKRDQQIHEFERNFLNEQSDENQRVKASEDQSSAQPSTQSISSPGRIAQGYYVSLGVNLFSFFHQLDKSAELTLFGRYSEHNTHYKVDASVVKDKSLYKSILTMGLFYKPKKKRLALKLNFQRHVNYYLENVNLLEGSLSFAF